MVRIRIDLDERTYEALVERAIDQRRPTPWEAEHIIRRALNRRTDRGQQTRELVEATRPDGDGPRGA